ncbi:hypothetical protein TWF281_010800 [Arthrobotrys megalospora]
MVPSSLFTFAILFLQYYLIIIIRLSKLNIFPRLKNPQYIYYHSSRSLKMPAYIVTVKKGQDKEAYALSTLKALRICRYVLYKYRLHS